MTGPRQARQAEIETDMTGLGAVLASGRANQDQGRAAGGQGRVVGFVEMQGGTKSESGVGLKQYR